MAEYIVGNNPVTLGKNQFVASGGQAQVFSIGDVGYKVYHDPAHMIPVAKINELKGISDPSVIRPTDLILDKQRQPVGYTMRFLRDTYVLCQLFTKTFCDKHRIDNATTIKLVRKLKDRYQSIHAAKILVVDGNEQNFLVDDGFSDVYAIDSDSYSTPSFGATVIMDSIRDRHMKSPNAFTQGTDWFSFAVVSCFMFMKIHPYRGKHPSVTAFEDRMLRNISIFSKDVSIPAICPDFSVIPQNYKDWYKAVFDRGERVAPPDALQSVILLATKQAVLGGKHFTVAEIDSFADDVVRYFVAANGQKVTVTTTGQYLGNKKDSVVMSDPAIGAEAAGGTILASVKGGKLFLRNLTWFQDIVHSLNADAVMDYDGTIYLKRNDSVHALEIIETSGKVQVSLRKVADVMPKSTGMYDGVVIDNCLGTHYATIFPKRGKSYNIRLKELDKYKIFDAKFDSSTIMVSAANPKGEYEKFIYRLGPDFSEYDLRIEKCTQVPSLNFVVTPAGVCAHKTDDDKLELFMGVKGGGAAMVYDEPAVYGDARLFKIGKQVLFAKDNKVYSIEKRK